MGVCLVNTITNYDGRIRTGEAQMVSSKFYKDEVVTDGEARGTVKLDFGGPQEHRAFSFRRRNCHHLLGCVRRIPSSVEAESSEEDLFSITSIKLG